MNRSGTGNGPTPGGWVATLLLGVAVFHVLRHSFAFHDLSAAGFGVAAALFMLLLLTGSGSAGAGTLCPQGRDVPGAADQAKIIVTENC